MLLEKCIMGYYSILLWWSPKKSEIYRTFLSQLDLGDWRRSVQPSSIKKSLRINYSFSKDQLPWHYVPPSSLSSSSSSSSSSSQVSDLRPQTPDIVLRICHDPIVHTFVLIVSSCLEFPAAPNDLSMTLTLIPKPQLPLAQLFQTLPLSSQPWWFSCFCASFLINFALSLDRKIPQQIQISQSYF